MESAVKTKEIEISREMSILYYQIEKFFLFCCIRKIHKLLSLIFKP